MWQGMTFQFQFSWPMNFEPNDQSKGENSDHLVSSLYYGVRFWRKQSCVSSSRSLSARYWEFLQKCSTFFFLNIWISILYSNWHQQCFFSKTWMHVIFHVPSQTCLMVTKFLGFLKGFFSQAAKPQISPLSFPGEFSSMCRQFRCRPAPIVALWCLCRPCICYIWAIP